MNESLRQFLSGFPCAQPVAAEHLESYQREMTDVVIPDILEAIRERQRLAAEARVLAAPRDLRE